MTRGEQYRPRGQGEAPIDIRLVRDPIDFLAEEHLRRRQVLAALDALADAETPGRGEAAAALAHIETEMPLHHSDEDDDLVPLLRRRAEEEDGIDRLLARLAEDRSLAVALIGPVRAALERLAAGADAFRQAEREALHAYAAAERRQLIFENAIILPLSRVRLTAADRRTLALRMAARRGICLLPEPGHA